MRRKPGNIIGGVQFNVAAMDTGSPSILYDWSASDGNPVCFCFVVVGFFPPTSSDNAVGRSSWGQKTAVSGLFLFALFLRSEKLV